MELFPPTTWDGDKEQSPRSISPSMRQRVEMDVHAIHAEKQVVPITEPRKISFVIYYRTLAWFMSVSFYATVVIGGIVTYTATNYTYETDGNNINDSLFEAVFISLSFP